MALKEILKKYRPINEGIAQERMDVFQSGLDAVSVQHLSKSIAGTNVIDDLSICFPKGLVTALIGPEGSGKSTLIDLITGLIVPDCGSVIINEQVYPFIKPYELRKFKVARTFQKSRLIEGLSIEDNLLLGVAQNKILQGLREFKITPYKKRLEAVLVKTGLKEHRHKKAEELSFGLRKLLEIGRALMQDADVYIFDEPLADLPLNMAKEVLSIIDILRIEAKTVVLVGRNMEAIERLVDYVIVINQGKLLAAGAPKDVLSNKLVQEACFKV